jgi:drug/metabolite transporter (DMT)-like permease
VFALLIERAIWGTTPPIESFFGAGLIISAAIWISLQKNSAPPQRKPEVVDEESSLLGSGQERN